MPPPSTDDTPSMDTARPAGDRDIEMAGTDAPATGAGAGWPQTDQATVSRASTPSGDDAAADDDESDGEGDDDEEVDPNETESEEDMRVKGKRGVADDGVDAPPRPVRGGAPTRRYLNEQVTPVLLEGMRMLARERPENPLEVLGQYLIAQSRGG
ncbi:Dpy-30 motif-domain-containing protein [Dipodascopsis tothii]|uniref:Dpy-30 motif-domain-containing protein n=1 Tax=Dipodascopsis tothii TaxID=44089 RepID=UPI0034CFFEFE